MSGVLLKSVTEQDTATCLELTCKYLREDKIHTLQEEWIAISSSIGTRSIHNSRAWIDTNAEILHLLGETGVRVSTALLLTSKLCLLYNRSKPKETINLRTARRDIVTLIPENAKLASTGLQLYGCMMPHQDDPSFAFYSRLLASLSKLADDDCVEDIRACIEYISRKKNDLPVAFPTIPEAPNTSDPDWFLWGFLLTYYSSDPNVATNFKLYTS